MSFCTIVTQSIAWNTNITGLSFQVEHSPQLAQAGSQLSGDISGNRHGGSFVPSSSRFQPAQIKIGGLTSLLLLTKSIWTWGVLGSSLLKEDVHDQF